MGGNLAELSAFLEKQQMLLIERDAQAEAKRADLEGRMEAKLQAVLEKQRQDTAVVPAPAFPTEQLAAFQARLEALHAAQLLSDDEFFALEDVCADVIELEASVVGPLSVEMAQTNPTAARARKLMALSEKMGADAGLARQLRRKLSQ